LKLKTILNARPLFLTALITVLTVAFWLWRNSNSPPRTVTEAAAELRVAKARHETAYRWNHAIEQAAMQAGLTNAGRTAHNVGNRIVSHLFNEIIHAEVGLKGTRLLETANCCVGVFSELGTAQEALASLSLSGIGDVIIRPPEGGVALADQAFRLMVSKSNGAGALSVLKEIRVIEAGRYTDSLEASHSLLKLKSNGILASMCLQPANAAIDKSERVHVLYVLAPDKQTAQALLINPNARQ
jgi:hypothetical protein